MQKKLSAACSSVMVIMVNATHTCGQTFHVLHAPGPVGVVFEFFFWGCCGRVRAHPSDNRRIPYNGQDATWFKDVMATMICLQTLQCHRKYGNNPLLGQVQLLVPQYRSRDGCHKRGALEACQAAVTNVPGMYPPAIEKQ